VTSFGTGFPLLYLTTTGRRTGEQRTVPLLYVEDRDRLVVFASNWGKPRHPAWSTNLDADGRATVAIDGQVRRVVARRATESEAARLWPAAETIYPGYATYRRRAGRTVRVYLLE
jgi:deazaflavin-dependent oxidoreductase (nitroreductase family)